MAVLETLSFEDAVDLIDRKFDAGKTDPINNAMKNSGLVKSNTIPAGTGGTKRHKEVPVGEQYASRKVEWGQSVKTRVQQGYYKDTTSVTYSKSIDITVEMRQLDKTSVYNAMDFIGDVLPAREDLNLSMFVSFGTATSYTDQDGDTVDVSTGDGLSFWNPAHTLTGSTTTYRNRVANNPAFSEGALELAEDVLVTETFSNLGEQVSCNANCLFSTDNPTLVNSIKRLLQSNAQISAPNAEVVNVYKSKYKHEVLPRIDMDVNGSKDATKKNYWGIVDDRITSFFHDVYMEPQMHYPTRGNNGEDIDTLDWTFTTIAMHNSCIVAGRGYSFSTGDGVA